MEPVVRILSVRFSKGSVLYCQVCLILVQRLVIPAVLFSTVTVCKDCSDCCTHSVEWDNSLQLDSKLRCRAVVTSKAPDIVP